MPPQQLTKLLKNSNQNNINSHLVYMNYFEKGLIYAIEKQNALVEIKNKIDIIDNLLTDKVIERFVEKSRFILIVLSDGNSIKCISWPEFQCFVKTLSKAHNNTFITKKEINEAMIVFSHCGHIEMVKSMMKKGANNYNDAMEYASFKGHMDIVKLMLEKGANNYNMAMENASKNGHVDIVKLMLEKGANDYNTAMKQASFNNHINIVKLMLEKGANSYNWCINISKKSFPEIANLIQSYKDKKAK